MSEEPEGTPSEEVPSPERRSERLTVVMTPTELGALEFLQRVHEYDGVANVLRDFSIKEAVKVHSRSRELTSPVSAS